MARCACLRQSETMSSRRYIHHVTLDTGHSRRSYHDEVADEALAALHDGLSCALRREPENIIVPGQLDYTYSATREGKCMIATIWRSLSRMTAARRREMHLTPEDRVPVVTFGVAAKSLCGAGLWRLLHDGQRPYATDGKPCPPEPWLAARMDIGAALVAQDDPSEMLWMADFERCLAWTWLSRLEGQS